MLSFAGLESLSAQDYPTKPINIIVPFGAGGQSDLLMRLRAAHAEQYFGQPFVVKIMPGGGAERSDRTRLPNQNRMDIPCLPDTRTVIPSFRRYKRGKGPGELLPVALISEAFSAFYVQNDAPWKNFKEMIAWAKANPGQLVFGNTGAWSSSDFAWRWLEMNAGFTSRNVPHDGGQQATVALLGGHIQVGRLSSGHAFPHWRAGKIRPIVVAGSKRLPEMPDVPCMLEEGYDMKGLGSVWTGIFAPNGTPRPIIDKLAMNFKKITENKQAEEAIKKLGVDFTYLGPEEFDKKWREEYNAYRELANKFKK